MWKQINFQEFVDLKHGENLKPSAEGNMHEDGWFKEWSPDERQETSLIRCEYNHKKGNKFFRFEGR